MSTDTTKKAWKLTFRNICMVKNKYALNTTI